MTTIERDMDVERVKNVVAAFDWVLSKTEVEENKVILTIQKEFAPLEVKTDKGAS